MNSNCFFLILVISKVNSFCWKPNSTPFYGAPKVTRTSLDRARIEWKDVFNDGQDCQDVDFLIMIHPKSQPASYQLSDFTLKGERQAVMKIDGQTDFVFQVIAREDKGSLGIDYKYSDMVTSYVNGTSTESNSHSNFDSVETEVGNNDNDKKEEPPSSLLETSNLDPMEYDDHDAIEDTNDDILDNSEPNPWYIYECIPFIKEVKGYDAETGSQNFLLQSFLKQMNQKPLQLVNDFLTERKKDTTPHECSSASSSPIKEQKGYLFRCNDTTQMCCSSPFQGICTDQDCSIDYSACDGGRCIPGGWVADGWPDCLDGSDEVSEKNLPQQLVCISCAGVVLTAGFLCRETSGLTSQCVSDVMGNGVCNNCIPYYLNLP